MRTFGLGVAIVVVVLAVSSALAAATLDGEWVLVEQTYGEGQSNLANPEARLRLRIGASEAPDLVRVVVGEDGDRRTVRWPAFTLDDVRAGATEIAARDIDSAAGRLYSRYQVRLVDDPLTLEVEEDYRLDPGSGRLSGELRVRFFLDGEPRGGYVLRRSFERTGR